MESQSKTLSLIGNTPILELKKFDTNGCRLYVKLENQNPGGSIKDRIARSMIEAAEKEGNLLPGGTIVEATAGNTGIALALVATLKNYKIILVVPDKMSREKVQHLQALGAEVVTTRSDVGKGHPAYYQDLAEKIAKATPGAFFVNQFANAANPQAHFETTGPEIWEQMEHDLDAVVCGVGSGGTMTGLSKYFAQVNPKLDMVLADPVGSILTHYVKTGEVLTEVGSWLVEGIGEDFIPPLLDLSRVKHAYSISDEESLLTARELLKREGLLGGSSSGTLLAAALKYCEEQKTPKKVLTFLCDSGAKYLSKVFSDSWMNDQGLLNHNRSNNLLDLVSRKYQAGLTITVATDDTLKTAYTRMRLYDISQLPVIDNGELVGIIDEWDLVDATDGGASGFQKPVKSAMTKAIEILSPTDEISKLKEFFRRGIVPVIKEGDKFIGLITKADYLNYLHRTKLV
jgi:cystathionine beta-synthase